MPPVDLSPHHAWARENNKQLKAWVAAIKAKLEGESELAVRVLVITDASLKIAAATLGVTGFQKKYLPAAAVDAVERLTKATIDRIAKKVEGALDAGDDHGEPS